MRAIDADALIHELNNNHYPGAPYIDAGISIAIGKVCDAPTIEPEPCDDAVSRADVLESFADLYDTFEDCPKGIINELHGKFEDLRTLPSVTPKSDQCEDAVNRKDAAIQLSHNKNGDPDCDVIIQHDIETLKRLPSVTQKRTGKWMNLQLIPDDITGHTYGECSICGKLRKVDNYCPNCGSFNRGYDVNE
jgi:ribosomal protein L32